MTGVQARYTGHSPDRIVIRAVLGGQGTGGVARDLDTRARRVLIAMQQGVPVRTGTLLASIRRESGRDAQGPFVDVVIGVRGLTPYLKYIVEGTPPHVIRPRRRRALRFLSAGGGGLVFATKVNHPGTAPNDFLTRALRAAR